MSTGIILAATG